MIRAYLPFLRSHARFLLFGFFLTCFSSFGQTYFIALFSADVREAFSLSHGDFGLLYSLATLTSGLALAYVGRQLDRLDLRLFTVLVCLGLMFAALLFASAGSIIVLGLALFGLRITGQGLMSHIALTSMARYFSDRRGMAISIATMGFPLGTAVFPIVVVTASAAFGWQQVWYAIAAAPVLLLIPLFLWLLRGHAQRHREFEAGTQEDTDRNTATDRRQWALRDVVRDPAFYPACIAVVTPALIVTGIMFHQVHLAETKGWELSWFASCYPGFALSMILCTLAMGPLVDRYSARRLLPYYLPLLAIAVFVLVVVESPYAVLVFMMFSGLTIGASSTIVGALWAEVYGVLHLGAIRSLVSAVMVIATALSPYAMGAFIDLGFAMNHILLACCGYVIMAAVLAAFPYRRRTVPS